MIVKRIRHPNHPCFINQINCIKYGTYTYHYQHHQHNGQFRSGFSGCALSISNQHSSTMMDTSNRRSHLQISACSSSKDQSKVWDRIKSAVRLSQVFKDRLGEDALIPCGVDKYKVVCPFHNDVNPSLQIDDAKALFYCFGCGAAGSIIDFERLYSGNSSVGDALRSLGVRYPSVSSILGLSPSPAGQTQESDGKSGTQRDSKKEKPSPIPFRVRLARTTVARKVIREVLAQYQETLWHPRTPEALDYLINKRGLSETTIRVFGCGYAPRSARSDFALSILKQNDHDAYHGVLGGVARTNKSGEIKDIFYGRVITPIRDFEGSPIALAGRVISEGSKNEPKYVNGPETSIFKKKKVLFGADIARSASSTKAENGYILIVEGYMDVMTIFEQTRGRIGCVATMGTAISKEQLNAAYDLLGDCVDGRVIINMDNDEAGVRAVERLCDNVFPHVLQPHTMYVASPPPKSKDADEFLQSGGTADDYVMYILHTARPWYEWIGDRITLHELERMYKENEEMTKEGGDWNERANKSGLMEMGNAGHNSFESVHNEFLRRQRDEMLVSFGAPSELSSKAEKKRRLTTLPDVSDEVIEKLANIAATGQKCIPGINVSALVKSWADTLSQSQPPKFTAIFNRIVSRCKELSQPWVHHSIPSLVHWMPPAPWVVEQLPKTKKKSVLQSEGYSMDGDVMDFEDFMADPKRVRRSVEKMKFQEQEIIPAIMERRCESSKMLKIAPRQSAEEIVLRTLIFATEIDRLDALQELLEIILRCYKKKLTFWTSIGRHQLFEYLSGMEGNLSVEEMMGYLGEMEWWNEEVEKLFVAVEDEQDSEWQDIRAIETRHPVEVIKAVGTSIETMSAKVASRLAIEQSEEILEKLLDEAIARRDDKNVTELLAQYGAIKKDIDSTNFMNPEELQERKEEMQKLEKEREEEEEMNRLLAEVENMDIPE